LLVPQIVDGGSANIVAELGIRPTERDRPTRDRDRAKPDFVAVAATESPEHRPVVQVDNWIAADSSPLVGSLPYDFLAKLGRPQAVVG
jgi:hypothetical protein